MMQMNKRCMHSVSRYVFEPKGLLADLYCLELTELLERDLCLMSLSIISTSIKALLVQHKFVLKHKLQEMN